MLNRLHVCKPELFDIAFEVVKSFVVFFKKPHMGIRPLGGNRKPDTSASGAKIEHHRISDIAKLLKRQLNKQFRLGSRDEHALADFKRSAEEVPFAADIRRKTARSTSSACSSAISSSQSIIFVRESPVIFSTRQDASNDAFSICAALSFSAAVLSTCSAVMAYIPFQNVSRKLYQFSSPFSSDMFSVSPTSSIFSFFSSG